MLAVLALTFLALTLDPAPAVSPASAQDGSAMTVTAQQCEAAFYGSSARNSCSTPLSISVSDNRCRISVQCRNQWWSPSRPNENLQHNSVSVTVYDAYNLSNCNGSLTVGSC